MEARAQGRPGAPSRTRAPRARRRPGGPRPTRSVPVTTVPAPLHRQHAVDPQARGPVGAPRAQRPKTRRTTVSRTARRARSRVVAEQATTETRNVPSENSSRAPPARPARASRRPRDRSWSATTTASRDAELLAHPRVLARLGHITPSLAATTSRSATLDPPTRPRSWCGRAAGAFRARRRRWPSRSAASRPRREAGTRC